jgi:hypothetical protein
MGAMSNPQGLDEPSPERIEEEPGAGLRYPNAATTAR